ncbi:MAG TPA: hypothetical protein VFV87_10610 [Pirellulaceae bacterium]|nr:hypothetical protein [Pirellulaceae bacterium]
MSKHRSGRSIVGLVLEISVIGLVLTLLPKFGFQQQPASPDQAAPPAANSWWQAAPTSWRQPEVQREVRVEQTLESASQQLLRGVDYATRAAADLAPPPAPAEPLPGQPQEWRRY